MSEVNYGQKSKWPYLALVSLVSLILLTSLISRVSKNANHLNEKAIVVYCAAGVRLPVDAIAKKYTEEFGTPIIIEYGSSGELESKLLQDASYDKNRADLYIPADESFSQRTKEKGLTNKSYPIAAFHLVAAMKPEENLHLNYIKDLLVDKIPFAICNDKAGAGKITQKVLSEQSLWNEVNENRKVVSATVTECASLVKSSHSVRVGIMWNTTAIQFGLKIIELPELASSTTSINVNLVSNSKSKSAEHFAGYLSSFDKSFPYFQKYGFKRGSE